MAARAAAESTVGGGGGGEEQEKKKDATSSTQTISSLLARVLRERADALSESGQGERARRDQEAARALTG